MSAFLGAINVKDSINTLPGAAGDGVTDDTAAIQRAFDAAVAIIVIPSNRHTGRPGTISLFTTPRVYFPPGTYKISSTLEFPVDTISFTIIGDDAIIVPDANFDDNTYALRANYIWNLRIKGLQFADFAKALYLNNSNNLNSAQLEVEDCVFLSNGEAIRLLGVSGLWLISKCKFYDNSLAMYLEGDKIVVRDCWIESGPMSGVHPSQIINYGILTFSSNLLVPEGSQIAPLTIEPAWINNYSSVKVDNTRQGGEFKSFTLINNFAKTLSTTDVHNDGCNIISVKDSQCYAVYNWETHIEPAVVRYVGGVPNATIVRNNTGMLGACRIVDFSYHICGDDPIAINNMIIQSGANTVDTLVEIANNIGSIIYAHGTYLPTTLYPFIRDTESLWPAKRVFNELQLRSSVLDPNNPSIIKHTFDYGSALNVTHLVNYVGCPSNPGNPLYDGAFVGLLKANGFWTGYEYAQVLVLETILNQYGNTTPGTFPIGSFIVSALWEATDSAILPYGSTNHQFYIRVDNRAGGVNADGIKVTPLDAL